MAERKRRQKAAATLREKPKLYEIGRKGGSRSRGNKTGFALTGRQSGFAAESANADLQDDELAEFKTAPQWQMVMCNLSTH